MSRTVWLKYSFDRLTYFLKSEIEDYSITIDHTEVAFMYALALDVMNNFAAFEENSISFFEVLDLVEFLLWKVYRESFNERNATYLSAME